MSNEPNKPEELTEKELEGIVGGARGVFAESERQKAVLVQTEVWTQTAAMPVQTEVWTQTEEVVRTAGEALSELTTTISQ